MNVKRDSAPTVTNQIRPHEALFNAPVWATKLLTIVAPLGMLATVSLVVGIGLATIANNLAPALLGLVLCLLCALPAIVLRWLVMRSLGLVYDGPPAAVQAGPQQTVLVMERGLNVGGKRQEFGQDRVTINAPADEVSRMLAWIKANPDRTSRAQVTTNAGISQTTWQRVMTALEEVGAVSNGGKSGYTVTDSLDGLLDRMDARL